LIMLKLEILLLMIRSWIMYKVFPDPVDPEEAVRNTSKLTHEIFLERYATGF